MDTKISKYNRDIPQANGILWQTLFNNTNLRRNWEILGVNKTLFQWIAVDGYSFIENPWLPTYSRLVDLDDIATYPWAEEIIIGTPGYFSEVKARASIPELADLAQKFSTLTYPSNVKGFYFPVEIDPTWTEAPYELGPYWETLPRPLYISAYYGPTAPATDSAQWLYDLLPQEEDVILLFQDGRGAFGYSKEKADNNIAKLRDLFGDRLEIIAEVFERNPEYKGVDGTYFRSLSPIDYRTLIADYKDWDRRGKLWLFDGPNYISSILLQKLNKTPAVTAPNNLKAVQNSQGDIKLTWDKTSSSLATVTGYRVNIYDVSGNKIIRTYDLNKNETQAFYPTSDSIEDFGFPPTFLVWEVAEKGVKTQSEFSEVNIVQLPIEDFYTEIVVYVGDSQMAGQFFPPPGIDPYYKSFENTYGGLIGKGPGEIKSINAALGSSVLQSDASLEGDMRYFWDSQNNIPGPLALNLKNLVKDEVMPVTKMLWMMHNDATWFGGFDARNPVNAQTYLTSLENFFNWVKQEINPNIQIHIIRAGWNWIGSPPEPYFPGQVQQLGLAESIICNKLDNVFLASDRIATQVSDFEEEDGNYLHFTPVVYKEHAIRFGEAAADNRNLALYPSDLSPNNMSVPPELVDIETSGSSGDIIISVKDCLNREDRLGVWKGYIMTFDDPPLILRELGEIPGDVFTYTNAQYLSDFGFRPTFLHVGFEEVVSSETSPMVRYQRDVTIL